MVVFPRIFRGTVQPMTVVIYTLVGENGGIQAQESFLAHLAQNRGMDQCAAR